MIWRRLLAPLRADVRAPGALAVLLAIASCLGGTPARLLAPDDPLPELRLETVAGPARVSQLVIVSIDGLRPDAIDASGAEQLGELIARGAHATRARTVVPSVTLPSHVSMLTGLGVARHGVRWNSYRAGYVGHPTAMSIAALSGRPTAMLFAKRKLHLLAHPRTVSWLYAPPGERSAADAPAAPVPDDAGAIARAFADAWQQRRFALAFVHFAEPDRAGHRAGWMSDAYLDAVRRADAALATIVSALEKTGGFTDTALIVTADHGGDGKRHRRWLRPDHASDVRIPWIYVGPGVSPGLVIDRPIRTYDTAPTALALLGLPIPPDLDGETVHEVLP